MRDIYEVLREKEHALERVRREIEALRAVAPLLADDATSGPAYPPDAGRKEATSGQQVPTTKWP
jgi:hypothetical protein